MKLLQFLVNLELKIFDFLLRKKWANLIFEKTNNFKINKFFNQFFLFLSLQLFFKLTADKKDEERDDSVDNLLSEWNLPISTLNLRQKSQEWPHQMQNSKSSSHSSIRSTLSASVIINHKSLPSKLNKSKRMQPHS